MRIEKVATRSVWVSLLTEEVWEWGDGPCEEAGEEAETLTLSFWPLAQCPGMEHVK